MALTTIPAAGAKLRGSVLSALITEARTLAALKTSDQNVGPSNVTLQDVSEMSIAVVANATYVFQLDLQYATNTTADIKTQWTGPAGFSMDFSFMLLTTAEAWLTGRSTAAATLSAGGGFNHMYQSGTIVTGVNAGTVQLQAAQQTSTAITTNVETGSLFVAHRIS